MSQTDFDDVSEYFEFKLGGHEYRMSYPTTEQMEEANKLDNDKRGEWVLSLIKPVEAEGPSLEETLKKVGVNVARGFYKRIKEEFNSVS